MLNKLLTLAIRAGVVFVIGYLIGFLISASLDGLFFEYNIPIKAASIIWVLGSLYSLTSFNDTYNFRFVTNAVGKINEMIDHKNKQKIENSMLRIKKLLDNNILTEDEYCKKIKLLKDKYMQE